MNEKQKAHDFIKNALNNKKRIAEKLNGINYPCEIPLDIIRDLAIHNLVAVFCVSDDLVYLKGTISEDRYMNNGDFIFFDSQGIMKNECEDMDDCPYYEEKTDKAIAKIELSNWGFNTDISHETFEVLADGKIYCVGIVFDMKDIIPFPKPKVKSFTALIKDDEGRSRYIELEPGFHLSGREMGDDELIKFLLDSEVKNNVLEIFKTIWKKE